ncbi:MAG: hypothetical protein ACREEM_44455, partial [Blastocatellia bacterium]
PYYCPPRLRYPPLPMKGNTKNEWQYQRAFVIQFRPETDLTSGRWVGRAEHVASFEATRFHSLDELLAFLTRMLSEARAREEMNDERPAGAGDTF